MNTAEVYDCLCIRDKRNPLHSDIYDTDNPVPGPESKCFCDNCFYGRNALAVEILRLRDELSRSTNDGRSNVAEGLGDQHAY